ncbi:response regulator transcription factor [Streptomyces sp. NPDC048383]|uniref:response regulator n=1 Tax=Streptomyces sp. NPDC048383 TaxID=3155386 RepID=UPI00341CF7AE
MVVHAQPPRNGDDGRVLGTEPPSRPGLDTGQDTMTPAPGCSPDLSFSVLLCDDNLMLLETLREVLQAQPDIEVVGAARDGEEALRLTHRHQPDLVVLDVRFPGGGPSVAADIARCSPSSRIVAFSAYDDKGTIGQMMDAGVCAYVLKGVSNRELLSALRRAATAKKAG